ncbi:MAG TPA: hypothetical protein VKH14_04140 [Candidatus Udaeobacter sp.]|nr:hypothetical protein [Candidatus Udaeobacter sp.]
MWRRWRVLAITAVAIIGIQIAQAAETSNNPAETEEVTVTAEANGSLTSVSPEESSKQKRQVAGGFTIKSADEMKLGRASNFGDLLQRTQAFSFNPKMAPKFRKFPFEGPELRPKMSHLA